MSTFKSRFVFLGTVVMALALSACSGTPTNTALPSSAARPNLNSPTWAIMPQSHAGPTIGFPSDIDHALLTYTKNIHVPGTPDFCYPLANPLDSSVGSYLVSVLGNPDPKENTNDLVGAATIRPVNCPDGIFFAATNTVHKAKEGTYLLTLYFKFKAN